jgi:hypothetical protein
MLHRSHNLMVPVRVPVIDTRRARSNVGACLCIIAWPVALQPPCRKCWKPPIIRKVPILLHVLRPGKRRPEMPIIADNSRICRVRLAAFQSGAQPEARRAEALAERRRVAAPNGARQLARRCMHCLRRGPAIGKSPAVTAATALTGSCSAFQRGRPARALRTGRAFTVAPALRDGIVGGHTPSKERKCRGRLRA